MNKDLITTNDVANHYDRLNSVVSLMLKGHNPSQISKELGMKRMDVVSYQSQWAEIARDNREIQERAKDAVTAADSHFSIIIKELWDLWRIRKTHKMFAVRMRR